jgi:CheY-like chemotaxis protein
VSYRVLEAENGKAAARQIETIEVDLLIMNLAMPKKVLKPSAHCTSSGHGLSVAVLLEARTKEGGAQPYD